MKNIKVSLMLAFVMASGIANGQENMKPNQKHFTQTAGRTVLGEIAPEFAHLNDDILFGEVWNRQDEMSAHDRSLFTIVTQMAQGLTGDALKAHIRMAREHGVSLQELTEVITHAAFYCGWPKAWAVLPMVKEIYGEHPMLTKDEFQMATSYPIGEPNSGYAQYFVGNSYVASLDAENGGPVNVTFEPGCRNNWHIHHRSVQVLVCVAGRGWYVEEGKEPVEMLPGKVIAIPAEAKHWHGAARDSWFQHLTYMTKVEDDASTTWLEPVTDEEYDRLSGSEAPKF